MARRINKRSSGGTMSGAASNGHGTNIPCKYVTSEGVCERYSAHIQNNDYAAANQEIQDFATQENISFTQANSLIQVCCGFRTGNNNGKCDEDLWLSMPQGTVAPGQSWWGKADYCKRCEVDSNNTSGLATNGNFPVFLMSTSPYWNPDPNGKNYCHCCENDNSGDYTCETFQQLTPQQQAGYCQKWQQAQGNPLAMSSEIQNLATILSISLSYAEWIFINCCGDCPPTNSNSPYYTYGSTHPDDFCNSDFCVDNLGNPLPSAHPDCVCCDGNDGPCPPTDMTSPFYTNPAEFCGNCGPGQGYANHPDCKCCDNQPDISRYRCDAGGCLECPPGTPASVCPHNEDTCANTCSTPPTQGSYYSMTGTKTNHWIPLLILGASLVVGIYISEYATKKLIK